MKRLVLILSLLVATLAIATSCGSLPFIASSSPTDVPTRTPRPTFTPRSAATATSAATTTSAATNTVAATDVPVDTDTPEAQPSDTAAPVARATRPPAPPAAPTQPPAPQFPVYLDQSYGGGDTLYQCPQEGAVFEVLAYLKSAGEAGKRKFAVGYYLAAFAPDGTWLKDYNGKNVVSVTDNGGMAGFAWGSNCERPSSPLSPDRYNGKLDLADVVRQGTKSMNIRFVASPTDATPLSKDMPINFNSSGRWWMYLGVQQ